jgi:hypothetical protein
VQEKDRELAAWDLLAAWGAISRLRPELLDTPATRATRDSVEALVRTHAKTLASLAMPTMDMSDWLRSAQGLRHMSLDEPRQGDASKNIGLQARELLVELDEAELARWAAEQLLERHIPGQLEECAGLVASNPLPWTYAWHWMRALARALDPALGVRDPDLALTALKLLPLLEQSHTLWDE